MQWLDEQENEQCIVTDLVSKMHDLCGGEADSAVWMKQKILEHYDDNIIFSDMQGKANVITFRKQPQISCTPILQGKQLQRG